MKINLTICGVHEFPEHEGKRWTHVISIWGKDMQGDPSCREQIMNVAPCADHHFSFFDDTEMPHHPNAPNLQDVKRILNFTGVLPERAKVLVHCQAGVSRSTAIAYTILCQHSKPGMEMENLRQVYSLRNCAYPNRLIVELAEKSLHREGQMLLHLHRDV